MRLAGPQPVVQLPGEKDEMVYIPLGVGVVIPPWNFPLAILVGMTVAALVTGNTVVIKPSSETPTIAAKFAEVLLEAGFPEKQLHAADRQRRGGRRCAGAASEDALRFVHRLARRRPAHQRTGREARSRARSGSSAWSPRWAARTRSSWMRDADLDKAVDGVLASAFGYQGQKCSACSRAIVDAKVYDEFVEKLAAKAKNLKVGPPDDPGELHGSGDQRGREEDRSWNTSRRARGRAPGRGRRRAAGRRLLRAADGHRGRRFQGADFSGGDLRSGAGGHQGEDFEHALRTGERLPVRPDRRGVLEQPEHLRQAREQFHVGNLYFNRKCTGAMVGAHPFGGFNMSGTDSKAGGPDYLLLFLQAKSVATKV